MARQFDALLSALAHDTPIDWRALEGQSWGAREADLATGLPATAPARIGQSAVHDVGAWALRAAWWGWAAVLSLAGVQLVATVLSAPAWLSQAGPSAPSGLLLFNVVLFGGGGGLLVFGSRQDRRVLALGALFIVMASAFAYPLMGRAVGEFGWLLAGLSRVPVDGFLATALWLFVWAFPSPSRSGTVQVVGKAFVALSGGLGVFLVAANVLGTEALSLGTSAAGFVGAFDRDSTLSLYWLFLFGVAAPAVHEGSPQVAEKGALVARLEPVEVAIGLEERVLH